MRWLIPIAMIAIGIGGWRILAELSSDAAAMALGLFLGVFAGIPTSLLILASGRRRPWDSNLYHDDGTRFDDDIILIDPPRQARQLPPHRLLPEDW